MTKLVKFFTRIFILYIVLNPFSSASRILNVATPQFPSNLSYIVCDLLLDINRNEPKLLTATVVTDSMEKSLMDDVVKCSNGKFALLVKDAITEEKKKIHTSRIVIVFSNNIEMVRIL